MSRLYVLSSSCSNICSSKWEKDLLLLFKGEGYCFCCLFNCSLKGYRVMHVRPCESCFMTLSLLTDSKIQYPKVYPGAWMIPHLFGPTLPWSATSSDTTLISFSLFKISIDSSFSFDLDLKLFHFICLNNTWLSRFFYTDVGIDSCDWSFGLPSSRPRCQVAFGFPLLTLLAFGDCSLNTSGNQNRTLLPKRHENKDDTKVALASCNT